MANCSNYGKAMIKDVNKRIKQKYIIILYCPIFRFENKPSSGAKGTMEI